MIAQFVGNWVENRRGSWFKSKCRQNMLIGKVPEHLQSSAEVSLSKPHIGLCDEMVTHPGVDPVVRPPLNKAVKNKRGDNYSCV